MSAVRHSWTRCLTASLTVLPLLLAALAARGETFTVTATAVGGGSVDAASKMVAAGGTVSFTATADADKELYAWFGAPSNCASRLERTIVISNVTENLDLTARFGTPCYVEECDAAQDAAGYGTSPSTPYRTATYAAANAPEYSICHLKGTLKPLTTIDISRPVRLAGYGTNETFISGKSMKGLKLRLFTMSHADAVFDHVKFIEYTSSYSVFNEHKVGALGWVSAGLLSDVLVYKCALYEYHNDGMIGNSGGHVVRLEVDAATISGSRNSQRGFPYYQSGGYAYDCYFHDCADTLQGGNTRIDGGVVDHCRIVANGIRNFGSNANYSSGAGVWITGGTLMNSLIRGNTAESAAAGIYASGKSVISNCTVVGNVTYVDEEKGTCQSGLRTGSANPRISRCIFWKNGLSTSPYAQCNAHEGTMTDCLTLADPMFVDEAAGDYRLKIGSPAIALGAGCEPYVADNSSLRCGFGVATNTVPAGGSAVLTAMVEGAGANAVSYAWYLDDAATPFATTAVATLENLTAGYRKVTLAVTAGGTTVESTQEQAVNVKPLVAYVSDTGSSTYPYDTAAKATASFTDAFCALWQGPGSTSDLYVAAGVYKMKACHTLKNAVRVHGAGMDETRLNGQYKTAGNFRAFYLSDADALLENLCVSNVYFYYYNADGGGGGAKILKGTVRNCRFQKCDLETAYQYPAAIWMSDGLVADCDFVECWMKWLYSGNCSVLYTTGGLVTNCVFRKCNKAISNNGTIAPVCVNGGTMDACQIVGNGGSDWVYPGAGLYLKKGTVRNTLVACNTNKNNWAGVSVEGGTLEHCTIAGNVTTADSDGRSGLVQSGGTVRNCIVYGNGPSGSTAGSVSLSAGTFVTNIIDLANARAVDCPVANPGFKEAETLNFRLKLGSAAIDAGANVGVDHDLDGNVRPLGNGSDIGAYEYVPGSSGFICSISITQSAWPSGSSPEASASVEGASGEVAYAWYADGGEDPISTDEKLVWSGAANGKHALRLVVTSGGTSVTNDVAEAFDVKPLETYVGPSGSNEYPYDTPARAAASVNDAYAALWVDTVTPVTVHVLEGTVPITDTINLSRKVSIVGAGAAKSVIDGRSKWDGAVKFQGFLVKDENALIADVCISNICYNFQDSSALGAGVKLTAGTVRDCRITGCWTVGAYQGAAGAYVNGGLLCGTEIDNCFEKWSYDCHGGAVIVNAGVVSNCWIHNNPTPCKYGGAGATVQGTGLITHSCIEGNGISGSWNSDGRSSNVSSGIASGVYVEGNGILRSSLVYGNTNSTGCAGVNVAGGRVEHCTVYGNAALSSATANSGLVQSGGTVKNSIVFGNGANYKTIGSVVRTGGTFATNLVDIVLEGTVDCLASDPSFKNAATNDFRLKLGSPAIDKGSALEGCETDFALTVRDEAPDLGAYEYVSAGGPLVCGITISQTEYPLGGTPTAEATAEGEDLTDLAYAWYVDGGEEPAGTSKNFTWNDAPAGRHALRLVVTNGGGETAEALEAKAFDIHPFVTYASTNGASVYPYDTQEKAATNVNDALSAVWSQQTTETRRVAVAEGTYVLTDTLSLTVPLTLEGAGADKTVFDASQLAKRAFYMTDAEAVATGFEIRGLRKSEITVGNAYYQSAGTTRGVIVSDMRSPSQFQGATGIGVAVLGGVFEDSVITNCEAVNTYAMRGGALYLSDGIVRNCTIAGNRKTGTWVQSELGLSAYVAGGLLENSRIIGNTASNVRAGVVVTGGTVRNCLIAGNVGTQDGDALYVPSDAGTVEIENCTIVANGTASISAAYLAKGTLVNSIVYGNAGTNLVKEDVCQVKYSCWPENTSTFNGNLVGADPKLRRDYRLRRSSPCVDAGSWTLLGSSAAEVKAQKDAAGKSRLVGENVDMGCFENQQTGLLLIVR